MSTTDEPIGAKLKQVEELINKNELRKALQLIDEILDKHPKQVEAYILKSHLFLKWGKPDAVIRYAEEAISLYPSATEAWFLKGVALSFQNRIKEALEAFSKAMLLEPNNPNIVYQIGINLSKAHSIEADKFFDKLLQINWNTTEVLFQKALLYNRFAKYSKALETLDKLLKIDKNHIEALKLKAYILLQMKKLNKARKALEQVLKVNKRDTDTWTLLGIVSMEDKDYKEATYCFKKAIKIDPNVVRARQHLIQILLEEKEWEEAARHTKYLLNMKDFKHSGDLWNALGIAYSGMEKWCEAAEAFRKAERLMKERKRSVDNITALRKAASYNCSQYKKAERARKEHEKQTRYFEARKRYRNKK